jgi:AraC-like DNA-binding protein
MDLARFIGRELTHAVADLRAESLIGPWPGSFKSRAAGVRFKPAFQEDHAHAAVEMCLLIEGACAFSYCGKHYRLRRGDLVFVPRNAPHAETYLAPERAYRLAWWIFADDGPIIQVTDYTGRSGFRVRERIALRPPAREARDRTRTFKRFAAGDHAPPLLMVQEGLLTLAASALRRLVMERAAERSGTAMAVVEQARKFIQENAVRGGAGGESQRLTIAEVARAVMLSPNYLTTLFREQTGVSLGRFILEERMDRAKALLADPRRSVKQAALALGFEDQYAFSRAFKRIEGASPARYRSSEKS